MTSTPPPLFDADFNCPEWVNQSIEWEPTVLHAQMSVTEAVDRMQAARDGQRAGYAPCAIVISASSLSESSLSESNLTESALPKPCGARLAFAAKQVVGMVVDGDLLDALHRLRGDPAIRVANVMSPVSGTVPLDQLLDPSSWAQMWRDFEDNYLLVADESSGRVGLLSRLRWLDAIVTARTPPFEEQSASAAAQTSSDATEANSAAIKTSDSEARYRLLAEFSTDLIACLAPNHVYTYVSPACSSILGYAPTDLLSSSFFDLFHPDDRAAWERTIAAVGRLPDAHTLSYRARRQDGSYVWLETTSRAIRDRAGEVKEIVTVSRDITERKQAEAELRRYEEHLEQLVADRTRELTVANQHLTREIERRQQTERSLFREKELAQITLRSIGDGVIATDARGRIEYLNPAAEQLTGWNAAAATGKPLGDVFQLIDETTRLPIENPVMRVMREGTIGGLAEQTLLIARDRSERAVEDSSAPICDRAGKPIGAVLVFRDVTQSRQLARQLSWQATHDELTGLLNRRAFERQLDIAISSARERGDRHILCFLDLDRFKVVNDTCGHAAGDELLRQIADLLRQQVRASDVVARFGGDEFGLLLYRCSMETARRIATSVNQELQAMKFAWKDKVFSTSSSMGLVAIDPDTRDLSAVLSRADAACYTAKEAGRNRIHIYQSGDRELTEQRGQRQWIARIHRAVAENRLCLYVQPIVPVASSISETHSEPPLLHYEVLLRFVDEDGSIVLPMAFIPAAERYNLMPELDRWVFRTLTSEFRAFCDGAPSDSRDRALYSVNLSGASLNDDRFLDFVRTQLQTHAIEPEFICFEVAETAAIANLSKASRFIRELKALGCAFALDDFGSGMSSFSYLKQLPVDYLKIDGNVIREIAADPLAAAVVESVHQIGHIMGIQTVAECVETDVALAKLQQIGIDFAQGYAIAAPTRLEFERTNAERSR
ncbi:MAG: EAL domain-containing protein [Cyanobacteria bacterium J06639_1]